MNKFLLEILVEYHTEGSFQEEVIYANIYADENFFQVRNVVLEKWESENPEKELVDYKVLNQKHYNQWYSN